MTETEDLGLIDALAQLSFLIQETLAKHAADNDVSLIQMRLLGILRDRKPTMQELAGFLRLDKSSVSGLVDRAEKRGLVRRIPATDDKRSVHVALTPAGRRSVNRVAQRFATDLAAITAVLSAADQQRLSLLASKVVLTAAVQP